MLIPIEFVLENGKRYKQIVDDSITVERMILNFLDERKLRKLILKWGELRFIVNNCSLDKENILRKRVKEIKQIKPHCIIEVRELHNRKGGGGYQIDMEINIQFIKAKDNNFLPKNGDLFGLLKLCLLKEISSKINNDEINNLNDEISMIIKILKNGYIFFGDPKEKIAQILKKLKGSNIINFSKYVDQTINSIAIDNLMNKLSQNDLKEIKNIKNILINYSEHMKLFEKEFERAKKNSIFEFSIISLAIIQRKDYNSFSKERENCENRVDRILFHGTGINPISLILTDFFHISEVSCQHGKGVYFTEDLDNCWFYGDEIDNRKNGNEIPNIGECFHFIASSIYYNKYGFRRVYDSIYTPKKNEINFAYANSHWDTIYDEYPDRTKFVGTEFVINDPDQICPFIGAKLKRDEYCVIWRDNNFSSNPVYNNEYDEIFKAFLKERIKYIQQTAKFNIYPCETSKEALELIKKKKYNKIILISNVGSDLGGKEFIINARQIIGNDVITLFLAYNQDHINWIKNFKNALFSNDANFYEEYLESFYNKSKSETINSINELKTKIEKRFNVNFNFDSKFLDYPNFKTEGHYSDLSF